MPVLERGHRSQPRSARSSGNSSRCARSKGWARPSISRVALPDERLPWSAHPLARAFRASIQRLRRHASSAARPGGWFAEYHGWRTAFYGFGLTGGPPSRSSSGGFSARASARRRSRIAREPRRDPTDSSPKRSVIIFRATGRLDADVRVSGGELRRDHLPVLDPRLVPPRQIRRSGSRSPASSQGSSFTWRAPASVPFGGWAADLAARGSRADASWSRPPGCSRGAAFIAVVGLTIADGAGFSPR